MRSKYFTKFSGITLKVGLEPEDFIKSRLALDQHPMKIYRELELIAMQHKIPMVSKRTLYSWINRIELQYKVA